MAQQFSCKRPTKLVSPYKTVQPDEKLLNNLFRYFVSEIVRRKDAKRYSSEAAMEKMPELCMYCYRSRLKIPTQVQGRFAIVIIIIKLSFCFISNYAIVTNAH